MSDMGTREGPRRHEVAVAIVAVVAAVLLVAAGIGSGWRLNLGGAAGLASKGAIGSHPHRSSGGNDAAPNARDIAAKVDPAVVDIDTFAPSDGLTGGPLVPLGAGTGLILTASGQVLTNNHVVDGAGRIEVAITGRSGTFIAEAVGVDPIDDVALLQINGVSHLPTVTLADPHSLAVGDELFAIGNALGRGGTPKITHGEVTGMDRSITVADGHGGSEHLTGLIQTDARISPGDSGGALVNASGQVVGMITAARTSGFGQEQPSSKTGFAIPVDSAIEVVSQIRRGESSANVIIGKSGYMGVQVRTIDAATAAQLGLGVDSGVLVVTAVSGGPAADAGIADGSVITAIDGQPVDSPDALGLAIHSHGPGQSIEVSWVDANGSHTATVILVEGPVV